MLQKAAFRQEIENIVAIDQRGHDQHRASRRGHNRAIARTMLPDHRPRGAMTVEAMAAISFKSRKVALDAMRNLGRDRPLDWFSPERVDFDARSCSCLPDTFEGSETVVNTGKAAHEVKP
jgi:hypothetical protein